LRAVSNSRRISSDTAIEKINCAYCSYANGAIASVREMASRTEIYWCPIKHAAACSARTRITRAFRISAMPSSIVKG
jgi:hypothetical protein